MTLLGHMVLAEGISLNLSKVKTVIDLSRPKIDKEVRIFLGLVRYY